jgi:hypothetical protein
MKMILKTLSILAGMLTGFLSFVSILGLVFTVIGSESGPLVMRVGRLGVTSDSIGGFVACALITLCLLIATWVFISYFPRRVSRTNA